MALDPNTPRSRRALLAAAAGSAAAVAASAAAPLTVSAAAIPMLTETAMSSTAQTGLSMTSATTADVTFRVENTANTATALLGASGDQTGIADNTAFTGVYGWAPEAPFPAVPQYEGSGVWGDSPDDGVVGTGGLAGVLGLGGSAGVVGIGLDGVIGVGDPAGVGVRAYGNTATAMALAVSGKAVFSRSGRATIGAGKSSIKINLAGVSWSSLVFAVLRSNRSGRYVRAVVPTTGSFTIYLNTTVTASTYVVWFVLN